MNNSYIHLNCKYEIRYLKTNTLYIRTAAKVEVIFAISRKYSLQFKNIVYNNKVSFDCAFL